MLDFQDLGARCLKGLTHKTTCLGEDLVEILRSQRELAEISQQLLSFDYSFDVRHRGFHFRASES